MKLTVLGGGGVRSPLLAKSIVNRARLLGLDEIVFMDNDREKLEIYGGLAAVLAARTDEKVVFRLTSDPEEALKGADFIITTLRVGQDKGRVLDERTALEHGILGQETTGAGGFAMAMRSIPALKVYCELAERYAKPSALIFNFTNPSGLVTQALRDEGYDNVYGICDGPSEFIKELERYMGVPYGKLSVECFGLNHLSWYRSVKLDGTELIDKLINDPGLYEKTDIRFFDPGLVKSQGMLLNSYLYYYYHREKAIENIKKSDMTRGEAILGINARMSEELRGFNAEEDFEKAIEIYLKYYYERENSYMAVESGAKRSGHEKVCGSPVLEGVDDGGYAGVALNLIESFCTGRQREMVLLVPNEGSIEGLADEDVVEITCRVGAYGAKPAQIGKVPDIQMNLISQVKLFERLAVKAIREKSIETGIEALMVHPLVGSYSLAKSILYRYIEAHAQYVGKWK